ncbi:hypothetical protein EDD18DRAFT_1280253 [Armillaria luteobubalina]|uniref:Heterokaryon incompatibility domain-containing protein n=1 Tax=Armillaria luteobubalina TaxID=153913 RepID=A0AA39QF86_9AGAR|nr:hypothetical protein EDD18DRAFT_1280253 [Armillaria luteobubalina]
MDALTTTLGTHRLRNPFLASLLENFVTNEYDFGTAHSYLRQIWYTDNWGTIQDEFLTRQEKDREERRAALVGNRIINPRLPPRRVWDLYSNRVVPWWLMRKDSWPSRPISHAWMDEKDRTVVWTPINGKEWPVPIPKDADLNLIRIEMLNLGLEYTWLDVLCLRQEGGRREDLCAEEWKLDVPTIGRVYHGRKVVCYLSGLGRPLTLKEGDLDSDRSWFRRAWTLQEVGWQRVISGDTPDGPLHAKCTEDGEYETELLTRFYRRLELTICDFSQLPIALAEMRNRVSTNPVDRIAGLAFLLWSKSIPAYYERASLEDAWTALVHSMDKHSRAELFVTCAEPGDGGIKWRPSWEQVMMKPLLPYWADLGEGIDRNETGDEDWCDARCIKGFVQGLAVVEGGDRHGKFIVDRDDGIWQFKITAAHKYPIPEDIYTLIYFFCNDDSNACVIGRSLPGGRFEKVSVLKMSNWNLRDITEEH